MSLEICKMMEKGALYHKRLMTKILERFGLTYAQFVVIKAIYETPGITAKEILSSQDTDKATLSGILSRLEKNALIERRNDPKDKRLVHIYLSDASKRICEEVTKIETNCQTDLLKGIRTSKTKHFIDGFKQVLKNQEKLLKQTHEKENS